MRTPKKSLKEEEGRKKSIAAFESVAAAFMGGKKASRPHARRIIVDSTYPSRWILRAVRQRGSHFVALSAPGCADEDLCRTSLLLSSA